MRRREERTDGFFSASSGWTIPIHRWYLAFASARQSSLPIEHAQLTCRGRRCRNQK
jgi:hypothetical protein